MLGGAGDGCSDACSPGYMRWCVVVLVVVIVVVVVLGQTCIVIVSSSCGGVVCVSVARYS